MTDTPEFSRPYKVDALPPKGRTVDLDPGADELAAIAERLDLIALNSLDGELKLRPEMGRQVSLSGSIRAEIVQTCVVSGEPLTTTIAFDVERTFAEDADPLAGLNTSDEDELTDPDLEEPDPIVDGRIDMMKYRPIARMGYMDYTVVDNVFSMDRPDDNMDTVAARHKAV